MLPTKRRLFISFSSKDERYRNLLLSYPGTETTLVELVDLSAKEPLDDEWKTSCRNKIKDSDGLLGLITANTADADDQLWEILCAYEESVPVLLMFASDERPRSLPELIRDRRIVTWSWDNVTHFLKRL
jgi:hypothetical protein